MSTLLKEIKCFDKGAAAVLEKAELRTDSKIKLLTREDLRDLFPGPENFGLRKGIFGIIQKQPVNRILRDLKGFIPDQFLKDALTNNGVLVEYLGMLKDMKNQMDNVQNFIDAHIGLLEEFSTNQPERQSETPGLESHCGQPDDRPQDARGTDASDSSGSVMLPTGQTGEHPQGSMPGARILNMFRQMMPSTVLPGTSTSAACGPAKHQYDQTDVRPPEAQDTEISDASSQTVPFTGQTGGCPEAANGEPFTILSPQDFEETTLRYQMVIGGKTFNAEKQLMEKVKEHIRDSVPFIESNEDYQITFVFCPISSRVASDVEAVMAGVKGDKPVILVLMYHMREVKPTASMRTWNEDKRVVLHVSVFYHETVCGLLKCGHNNAAVSEIYKTLQESFNWGGSTGSASGCGWFKS
ncbi:uncharacterized protein LOC121955100 isoform X2 [Plectropomus leopardus]|uniref:uncharacterized protein LOC121955100 isoform X2 n=1 Tax=Plectropomus leopardus TaxID=160734 RepID=UPI001C4AF885|nr:uncharacterized protein LOC121955100 isoform X2 [Plectropomus leopardus]